MWCECWLDLHSFMSLHLSRGSVPGQRLSMLGGHPDAHQFIVPQTYQGQSSQCASQASVQAGEKESYDPRETCMWLPQGLNSLSQAVSEVSSYLKTRKIRALRIWLQGALGPNLLTAWRGR